MVELVISPEIFNQLNKVMAERGITLESMIEQIIHQFLQTEKGAAIGEKFHVSKVTEQGLLIPRQWLTDMDEVEIRQLPHLLLIVPRPSHDPIFQLGTEPILEDITDASIQHDKYLYRA